jgi:HSP20 family molecular chaperone IbpA
MYLAAVYLVTTQGGNMSPTTRLARRRPMPLPQIFSSTRFPDIAQLMDNAMSLLPDLPELTEFTQTQLFPPVNVSESTNAFSVTAELPGLAENDVKVEFTDGVLTIRGDKIEEHTAKEDGTKYHIWERRSGSFQRSFPFPGGVAEDKITADFKDGVLTIQLPKATEEQAKRRSIRINSK